MSDFLQILKREEETKSPKKDSHLEDDFNTKKDKETIPDFDAIKAKKKAREEALKSQIEPVATIKNNDKEIYKLISSIKSGHILKREVYSPVWLSIAEASKFGGIQTKTLRRAIKAKNRFLKYKIKSNRYLIDFRSLILFLHSNRKLENKLYQIGIGQYIRKWRE